MIEEKAWVTCFSDNFDCDQTSDNIQKLLNIKSANMNEDIITRQQLNAQIIIKKFVQTWRLEDTN